MKTSIIILTYNKLEYTQLCIKSIREFTNPDEYELIIVDNNSSDGTVDWLREQNDLKVIYNSENMGFPKGCNQGMEIATGENILLLNNDVIVTSNWLNNLVRCLYSDDAIGAVGAVTNNCSNYQTIETNYNSMEEMFKFAKKHNKSNSQMWEQRLKLVGFCMLIKRSVVEQVGMLDERFTPGNYEDDDYSFRIIESGYKLVLCKDTFIYHFGSTSFRTNAEQYNKLLVTNRKKFEEKWGFVPDYSCFIRNEIIDLIDIPMDKEINVLEIGCACGGTLLQIRNKYKNANLYGVELNENSANICKHFADVKNFDIEKLEIPYPEKHFDFIIFADVLEHLYNPEKVLLNFKKHLKDDGKVLASIPNVMHYSVIWGLLNGNWSYEDAGILDKTHLRFFTLSEINKLFCNVGYTIEIQKSNIAGITEDSISFVNKLSALVGRDMSNEYNTYQYIISASGKIKNEIITECYNNIITERNIEESVKQLIKYNSEQIISNIEIKDYEKANLLNFLAMTCYENGITNNVLDYLKKACELDNDNTSLIYNLGYILFKLGNYDEALNYLVNQTTKNESVVELINLIKENL